MTVKFLISQYFDGKLKIECIHMHYAFDDRFNFDGIPKEDLFNLLAEIQEHCDAEGIEPIFVIL